MLEISRKNSKSFRAKMIALLICTRSIGVPCTAVKELVLFEGGDFGKEYVEWRILFVGGECGWFDCCRSWDRSSGKVTEFCHEGVDGGGMLALSFSLLCEEEMNEVRFSSGRRCWWDRDRSGDCL